MNSNIIGSRFMVASTIHGYPGRHACDEHEDGSDTETLQ